MKEQATVRLLVVALLAALSACANTAPPVPSGPTFAFNPGQWNPSAADLAAGAHP